MVDIQLKDAHGAHGSYVTSYSTMDRIEGIVSVTPVSDVRFDNIEIAFIGLWIPDYSIPIIWLMTIPTRRGQDSRRPAHEHTNNIGPSRGNPPLPKADPTH